MSLSCKKCMRKYYAKTISVFALAHAIAGFASVVALGSPRKQLHATGKRDTLKSCFVSSRSPSAQIGEDCSSMPPVFSRGTTFQYSQYQYENIIETEKEYFVSAAQFVHLGPAARILTEEFYSKKTNFITFQLERMKTALSLESTFPNQDYSIRKEYARQPLQQMFVACNAKNGKVIGFSEVDARSLGSNNTNGGAADSASEDGASNGILRSYMYNLAVDKKWKRKGIASALVKACEEFVSDTHDSCIEKRIYLRVRRCNHAAVALYENMGYREMNPETIYLNKEDINSGSLEDGELILFSKDLPTDAECVLD